MKRTFLAVVGCGFLCISMSSWAESRIIHCPTISADQYGKTTYYDPKSKQVWALNWLNKGTPVWSSASIPRTTTCGSGRSESGLKINYQCAVFQCKSPAVIASLEQNHRLKCFSTYVSTRNTFYCDGFTSG